MRKIIKKMVAASRTGRAIYDDGFKDCHTGIVELFKTKGRLQRDKQVRQHYFDIADWLEHPSMLHGLKKVVAESK
jgi:hypothetical protein